MSARMTISLNNLRFHAAHGWHSEEQLTGNDFEVDIFIEYTPNATIITNLDQTINYAAAYQVAKEVFAVGERLLETIAMKIAGALQVRFPSIERVQVQIRKLQVPIAGFDGTVAVSYSKNFR